MISRLDNIMDLMEKVLSFLESLEKLNYIEDYVVTHTIRQSKEIIESVEELKTELWENAKEEVKQHEEKKNA